MSLDRQLVVLTQQQISASEGLEMLRKVKEELDDNAGSMELWGMITILSNLVIIPLNCIVNALELKAADTVIKSIYQAMKLVTHFRPKYIFMTGIMAGVTGLCFFIGIWQSRAKVRVLKLNVAAYLFLLVFCFNVNLYFIVG